MERMPPEEAVAEVLATRYPGARVAFLAGSVIRGDHTETSDLDVVVVFDRLSHARRESFHCGGWPVEAFVHDPATLRYFCLEVDRPTGVPCLPCMVAEGREIPGTSAFSQSLKQEARAILEAGPPPWGRKEVDGSRYAITDAIDDLRAPRSLHEARASAARLYPMVADHFLRSRQLWSARGKTIPRRLAAVSPSFAAAFDAAFDEVFREGRSERIVALCEALLATQGGWHFAGYELDAPQSWRLEAAPQRTRE